MSALNLCHYFDDANHKVLSLLNNHAQGQNTFKNSLYTKEQYDCYSKARLSPILRVLKKTDEKGISENLYTSISLSKTDCQTFTEKDICKLEYIFIELDFKDKKSKQAIDFKDMRLDQDAISSTYRKDIEQVVKTLEAIFNQKPYSIVLSGGGFHFHYRLDQATGWTALGLNHLKSLDHMNDYAELNVRAYKLLYDRICEKISTQLEMIASDFEPDKSNKSLCRLMRDVGFMHEKDPKNKFKLSRIFDDLTTQSPISLSIFNQAIALVESPNVKAKQIKSSRPIQSNDIDIENYGLIEEWYNLKQDDMFRIYHLNRSTYEDMSISDLLKKIRHSNRLDFFKKFVKCEKKQHSDKSEYFDYTVQASLSRDTFEYDQSKEADQGSIFIKIKYDHNDCINPMRYATLEIHLRNKTGRYLDCFGGHSKALFPAKYVVDLNSNSDVFASDVNDFITNKLKHDLYLYRHGSNDELIYFEKNAIETLNVEKLDFLISSAIWVGINNKPVSFQNHQSLLKKAIIRIKHELRRDRLIEQIANLPILDKSFKIRTNNGYDPDIKTYVLNREDYRNIDLSKVHRTEIDQLIREEAEYIISLFRFPFKSNSHALSLIAGLMQLLLNPTMTQRPFILVNANVAGAGKTLLARAIATAISGELASKINYEKDEAKFKDEVIAKLNRPNDSKIALIIDNIDAKLGGGFLNAILTGGDMLEARPKHASQTIMLKILLSFIGTANNPMISDDTGRRIFNIHLEKVHGGLDQDAYRYDWRASENKAQDQHQDIFEDDDYLKRLAIESTEIKKSLIRLLQLTKSIEHEYDLRGLKRLVSFSDFTPIQRATFIIGKVCGLDQCDIIALSNNDLDHAKLDVNRNETFIELCKIALDQDIASFNPMMLVKGIEQALNDHYDEDKSTKIQALIDNLDEQIQNKDGKISRSILKSLLRKVCGKYNGLGEMLRLTDKQAGRYVWYEIVLPKKNTRISLKQAQSNQTQSNQTQSNQTQQTNAQQTNAQQTNAQQTNAQQTNAQQTNQIIEMRLDNTVQYLDFSKDEAQILEDQVNESRNDREKIFIYRDRHSSKWKIDEVCELKNEIKLSADEKKKHRLEYKGGRTIVSIHLDELMKSANLPNFFDRLKINVSNTKIFKEKNMVITKPDKEKTNLQ